MQLQPRGRCLGNLAKADFILIVSRFFCIVRIIVIDTAVQVQELCPT